MVTYNLYILLSRKKTLLALTFIQKEINHKITRFYFSWLLLRKEYAHDYTT